MIATKVYLMRWRIEEYFKFKKQQFELEDLRVMSLRKRSIKSILTKKYLIASRQVLVCDNDPAVFLTKAIDLPENSDPCHPYDLGFLTANIQNNRMV